MSTKTDSGSAQRERSLTVLLVDDEEIVRRTAATILNFCGYRTLMASDGPEALEMIQNNPSIDIVVLDVSMPLMSGDKVLGKIRELKPDLPVMVSSGLGEVHVLETFNDLRPEGFIQKPYTMRTLTDAIDNVIATAQDSRRVRTASAECSWPEA